jgi:hypothetical protein
MEELFFEPVSIIGRFAFGVICLEKLCQEWKVKSQQINELIEFLWTFTSSHGLDTWESCINDTLPDYKNEVPIKFGFDFLDKDKQETLTDTILEVIEIAGANLYGAFKSEYTMVHTLKVASLLETYNIELPDLKPFAKSKVTEFHGWGNPVDKSFFKNE